MGALSKADDDDQGIVVVNAAADRGRPASMRRPGADLLHWVRASVRRTRQTPMSPVSIDSWRARSAVSGVRRR
jgi:hypothetical protein